MMSTTAPLGPGETVATALRAWGSGDWQMLASFAEPQTLADWRESYLDGNLRMPTLEQLALEHPEAPPQANQRLLETHFKPSRQRFLARLEDHLCGVQTAEEAEALPAKELLARFWHARDPAHQMRRLYDAAGLALPAGAAALPVVRKFVIVREASLGTGRAAVTWRETRAGEAASARDESSWTLSQKPDGDWRIVLDMDFLLLSSGEVAHIIDDPHLTAYLQSLMDDGPDSPTA